MTEIRPLNEELKAIAKNELNEVESRIVEDISTLRTWIQKQPHLRARTDDQFLVTFLRGCKYSMEKAKSKIDFYYTIKALMPEIFTNFYMNEEFIELGRLGYFVALPNPLGGIGGQRIHLAVYKNVDPNKYHLSTLFRYYILVSEFEINTDDNGIISGLIHILDFSKLHLTFVKQFNPIFVKKLLIFIDKAEPMRVKGFHFVNCPKETLAILSIARNFLSEKLKQRFFIHKSLEDLYKVIPKENLPIEYGGINGSIPEIQADMEKKLLDFNNYFMEETKYGVDEKLRIGKKINSETLFGIDGSFRKLNID
ncbi:alpha-tocopherol transfer protein-like [Teleopsis dalmanni]|uniref:alpha-tocopherol transfer protein-like n=1 Tax=Teleopsis dalmanni TaxID=139649 RepID=UPI0018CF7466|nr:alpha-tocopherol transfer protein-like [Teleopsis dalmanni]